MSCREMIFAMLFLSKTHYMSNTYSNQKIGYETSEEKETW